MNNQLRRTAVEELMKPVVLVGKLLGKVYDLFFGRADELRSRKRDDEFVTEIQQQLSFLFEKHHGRVIPDERGKHPRPFDYVVAIVSLKDVLLRFTRGRGDLRVQVAPGETEDWSELSWLLRLIGTSGWETPKPFSSLRDVSEALEPNIVPIREAFSSTRRAATERQLSDMRQYEHVVARQLETEINRRLYPDK